MNKYIKRESFTGIRFDSWIEQNDNGMGSRIRVVSEDVISGKRRRRYGFKSYTEARRFAIRVSIS